MKKNTNILSLFVINSNNSSHVLSEDTIFREMRGDALYTRRLLTKTNRVPKWGERFVKNTIVSIVEESYVNPKDKTIITYTRNVGAYNRVMVSLYGDMT